MKIEYNNIITYDDIGGIIRSTLYFAICIFLFRIFELTLRKKYEKFKKDTQFHIILQQLRDIPPVFRKNRSIFDNE